MELNGMHISPILESVNYFYIINATTLIKLIHIYVQLGIKYWLITTTIWVFVECHVRDKISLGIKNTIAIFFNIIAVF